jgi:hypothetical protein
VAQARKNNGHKDEGTDSSPFKLARVQWVTFGKTGFDTRIGCIDHQTGISEAKSTPEAPYLIFLYDFKSLNLLIGGFFSEDTKFCQCSAVKCCPIIMPP